MTVETTWIKRVVKRPWIMLISPDPAPSSDQPEEHLHSQTKEKGGLISVNFPNTSFILLIYQGLTSGIQNTVTLGEVILRISF